MRQRSSRTGRLYTAIPNAAARDETMDIGSRGLLTAMMTYSDTWVFRTAHLQKMAACGKDKLQRMLAELQAHGYLVLETIRGDDGRVLGKHWVIIDDPFNPVPPGAGDDGEDDELHESDAPEAAEPAANPQPATASVGEKTAKTPGNDRLPGFPAVGKSASSEAESATDCRENRLPGFPAVGKPGPIRKNNLKNQQKEEEDADSALGDPSESAAKKNAGGDVAPDAELDRIAHQMASLVTGGKSYAASAIRPVVARRMLALGLVNEAQLRAVNVAH